MDLIPRLEFPVMSKCFMNAVWLACLTEVVVLLVQASSVGKACVVQVDCSSNEICSSNICKCDDGFITDNAICRLPRYEEQCTSQCADGFVCYTNGGICCSTSEYYDIKFSECSTKKGLAEICDDDVLCISNFVCRSGICDCPDGQYREDFTCEPKKPHQASCNDNQECKKNLTCEAGKCDCSQTTLYYDLNEFDCHLRKGYDSQCSVMPNECQPTMTCVSGKCKCLESQYLNGNQCTQRKGIDTECTRNDECMATLSCLVDKCNCQDTEYFDGTQCLPKKEQDSSCSKVEECKATLSCINEKCSCNDMQYYDVNEKKCFERKGNGDSCSNSIDCKETLLCLNNQCVCKPSQYFDDAIKMCVERKGDSSSCLKGKECIETLSCIDFVCKCTATEYFDTAYNQCRERKGLNDICQQSSNCKDTLTCIQSRCNCNDKQYYSNSQCFSKKVNLEDCDDNTQCLDPNAECSFPRSKNFIRKKCLCKDYYYLQTDVNICFRVDNLKVVNHGVEERKTDTISLKWTAASTTLLTVQYRIRYDNNVSPVPATASGGIVNKLTSGTSYIFSVESYIPADDYFSEKSTSVTVGPYWTFPSQPGDYNPSSSQVMTSPMTFGFVNAVGNFDQYIVTFKKDNVQITKKVVNTNIVRNLFLDPATDYSFEIRSVSGFGDKSVPRTGTFKTSAAASSEVTNLDISELTSNSVTLTWGSPSNPNGFVYLFMVQVFKDSNCITYYALRCKDSECSSYSTPTPAIGCDNTIEDNSFFSIGLSSFSFTISSLNFFTAYTVKVYPYNEAGPGKVSDKDFVTDEAAPEEIVSLSASSVRNESDGLVNVEVSWEPGQQTGKTNYSVSLVELQMPYNKRTEIVIGYENQKTTFFNVTAYFDYNVSVIAETSKGKSSPSNKTIKTKSSNPYPIQNLEIIPDRTYATRISLAFDCPLKWNGIMQGFIIHKKDNTEDKTTILVEANNCGQRVFVDYTRLEGIEVNKNYTFQVVSQNKEYESPPSSPESVYIYARVPVFETRVLGDVSNPALTVTTKTVSMPLCSSCLTSPIQGAITKVGLIVCVKSSTNSCTSIKKKRAVINANDFDQYTTWSKSKQNRFADSYRTTPDGWAQTLAKDSPSKFEIGKDNSCSTKQANEYCNGPLPSGKEFVIRAISCTVAGCNTEDSSFVIKTKAESGDDTDVAAIVVPIVLIIILIPLIVFAILYIRKHRKKKAESSQHVQFEDIPSFDNKAILIKDFKEHVSKLHKDSNMLFQEEFEDIKNLSAQFKNTCEEAQTESNRVKNRYVDILPYDHSRVKIGFSGDLEDASDFINANYIPGYNSKREYIATQGPMHSTIPHFWRMVWEQKSKVIVMLSDLMENNRMKVNLYWPENLNEPISYGDVVVEMTNFSQLNKYIIRNFKISVGSLERRVTHFFIPGWWDFSANLTFDDVLEFAQLVRKETTPPGSGPPVVHCSAGVGRTGTFIALDYFMQYIDHHTLNDSIDIFSYVLEMRKSRPRMVQAETQYIFIFDALVEVINRKIKTENEHLYDNYQPQEENIYANQMVTDHVYANTSQVATDSIDPNSPAADFSYTNSAFEDDNFEDIDLKTKNMPTTVL